MSTEEKNVVITLDQLKAVVEYVERLADEGAFELELDGENIKGFSAEATVDNTTGTPQVNVSKSVIEGVLNLLFNFTGMKGESGVYVGGGDMPENSNVQIDPEGDPTIISDGTTFTPTVSEDGTLSWTNNGELDNPAPINLRGPTGKSAYQIAVDQGYKGTESQWIDSLAGALVELSSVTATAEEDSGSLGVQVQVGGTATSKTIHFRFKNLKGATGAKGDKGDKGDLGITPNIQIGTVTTLPANSKVSATIGGTPEEPILNLGIPVGPRGFSPVPGTDFYTDEEKEEFISELAIRILGGHKFNASHTVPPEGSDDGNTITFVFPELLEEGD